MREYLKLYIDGQWVDPVEPKTAEVINPATEQPIGVISMGSAADVDRAVAAARAAFPAWSATSREERLAVLGRIVEAYQARYEDIATTISQVRGDERVHEIARMLSGSESEASLEHAEELLKSSVLD